MKRRTFIQSIAAVMSLPVTSALSVRTSATALGPAATAVPAQARSWAVYMATLHGECTPQTLQNLLHIPASDAKRYVAQLVGEGVIKANPLLQRSVSKLAKTDENGLLDRVKKRIEMKAEAASRETEVEPSERVSSIEFAEDAEMGDTESEMVDLKALDCEDDELDGDGMEEQGLPQVHNVEARDV